MKALLYKDFLVAKKYLRMIFLMDLVFVAFGIAASDNPFFSVFPLAMCSAMISNLVSYDERAHFDRSCDMMPVSRRLQVSEKYLIGVITPLVLALLCSIGIFRHFKAGTAEFWGMLLLLPVTGLVPSALMLPAIFKLGSERGRILFFLFYFAGLAIALVGSDKVAEGGLSLGPGVFLLVLAFSLALYAISWLLSVRFYAAREL